MLQAEYGEEMASDSGIFSFCPHRKHPQKFAQLSSKPVTSLPSSSPGRQSSGCCPVRRCTVRTGCMRPHLGVRTDAGVLLPCAPLSKAVELSWHGRRGSAWWRAALPASLEFHFHTQLFTDPAYSWFSLGFAELQVRILKQISSASQALHSGMPAGIYICIQPRMVFVPLLLPAYLFLP